MDQLPVTSAAACNSSLCATTYHHVCVANSTAKLVTYTTYFNSTVPSAQLPESGQICFTWTKTCSVDSPCSGIGLTAGSLTKYGNYGGNTSSRSATVTACGSDASVFANILAYTSFDFCNTDRCNLPPLPPGAASSGTQAVSYKFCLTLGCPWQAALVWGLGVIGGGMCLVAAVALAFARRQRGRRRAAGNPGLHMGSVAVSASPQQGSAMELGGTTKGGYQAAAVSPSRADALLVESFIQPGTGKDELVLAPHEEVYRRWFSSGAQGGTLMTWLQAKPVLLRSGLLPSQLSEIWNIAAIDGALNLRCFVMAMRGVALVQAGRPVQALSQPLDYLPLFE
jgi:hypothetical protein